jgi:hypothetical protein
MAIEGSPTDKVAVVNRLEKYHWRIEFNSSHPAYSSSSDERMGIVGLAEYAAWFSVEENRREYLDSLTPFEEGEDLDDNEWFSILFGKFLALYKGKQLQEIISDKVKPGDLAAA